MMSVSARRIHGRRGTLGQGRSTKVPVSAFHFGTRKLTKYSPDVGSIGSGIVPPVEKAFHLKARGRMPQLSRAAKKKRVDRPYSKNSSKAEEKRLPLGIDVEDPLTKKAITTYIPIVICLLILMFLDAAYSYIAIAGIGAGSEC